MSKIIKLTTKEGNSVVYFNADHIRTFIPGKNGGTELIVVQEPHDPFYFKETPEEIVALINAETPGWQIVGKLYEIEHRLCQGLLS